MGFEHRGLSFNDRLCLRGWDVADSGCWEICGVRHKQGYGQIKVEGKTKFAHRLAYEAWVGPIPEGHIVRHKCDNPPCVNPGHLETGTQLDNARDRESRNRHDPARGENAGSSKLTEDEVRSIRSRYIPYKVSRQFLANEYGVSKTTITIILSRKGWSHI